MEEHTLETQDMDTVNKKEGETEGSEYSLSLFDISNDEPVLLGVINKNEATIGREQTQDIPVPNQALSRQHGMFLFYNEQIFYRDLGSTNGSWCNGMTINAGQTKLIRYGDTLQLANTPIKVGKEENIIQQSEKAITRSLIVLNGNGFLKEVAIPDYGRAIVVGGKQADLTIQNGDKELAALIVERRGDTVSAFGLSRKTKAELNGILLTDAVSIYDADELKVGEYTIILNDLSSRRQVGPGAEKALVDMPPEALLLNPPLDYQRDYQNGTSEDALINLEAYQQNPNLDRSSTEKTDWDKLYKESTETMAFDPEIAKKFKMRSSDSLPGARSMMAGAGGRRGKGLPLPAAWSLEAWLAGFTMFCLVMSVLVIIYMVLFK